MVRFTRTSICGTVDPVKVSKMLSVYQLQQPWYTLQVSRITHLLRFTRTSIWGTVRPVKVSKMLGSVSFKTATVDFTVSMDHISVKIY